MGSKKGREGKENFLPSLPFLLPSCSYLRRSLFGIGLARTRHYLMRASVCVCRIRRPQGFVFTAFWDGAAEVFWTAFEETVFRGKRDWRLKGMLTPHIVATFGF